MNLEKKYANSIMVCCSVLYLVLYLISFFQFRKLRMRPTLLANSWAVAHLPGTIYSALLCCAGSAGEAAFRNSLDVMFAEMGFDHTPTNLKRRRQPVFHVIGTVAAESEATSTVHRICRPGQNIQNPTVFLHAQVFSNAMVLDICLSAVSLDLTSMLQASNLSSRSISASVCLKSVKFPPKVE